MKYSVSGDKLLSGLWGWRYSDVVFENSNISFHGCKIREGTLKERPSQEKYIESEALAGLERFSSRRLTLAFLMAQLFISVAFFPMGDLKGMLSCKQEARQQH